MLATMSSPQLSIVQTLGERTTPDVDRAVPHEAAPQRPAPKPKPLVPNGATNRVPLDAGAIIFCLRALGISLTPFHYFIFDSPKP